MSNVNTAIETQVANSNLIESGLNPKNSRIYHHSQFHEQKLVEKFCRESNLAKLIEGIVKKFLGNKKSTHKPEEALAPLLLRLDFKYTELVKHAPQLLHLIIEEPLQFAEAVKYSVYTQVRELLKDNAKDSHIKTIDIAQLHTQWRVLELPLQTNLLFDPSKYLFPLGLALVNGILSAYTLPEALILQTIWYCSSGCMRNAIQNTSTEAPLCPNCSRSMSEYQKLRVTENYCLAALLPCACVQTPTSVNRIYRAIVVRLRGNAYIRLRSEARCELSDHWILLQYRKHLSVRSMPPKKNLTSTRFHRQPVQLIDFLRADLFLPDESQTVATQSAVSNVSPIISGSDTTAASTAQPSGTGQDVDNNAVPFLHNDEDFPPMGSVRKKPKPSRPVIVNSNRSPDPKPAAVSSSQYVGPHARPSQRPKFGNKHQVVNKWLKSVKPPIAQSQQLPRLPPTSQYEACVTAPAVTTNVQQREQQRQHKGQLIGTHQESPPAPLSSLKKTSRTFSPKQPCQQHQQSAVIRSQSEYPFSKSLPMRGIVRTIPNLRSMPGDTSRIHDKTDTSVGGGLESFSNRQWNPSECRKLREHTPNMNRRRENLALPPSIPDVLLMPPSPDENNGNEASFMQERQQTQVVSSLSSQSQLHSIATTSSLNWNADEFRLTPAPTVAREPRNGITERRRRQRFHRSLKPNAMFELVSLPSEELPQSTSVREPLSTYNISPNHIESEFSTPIVAVSARTANDQQQQLAIENNCNISSQSVFRLASLPSTGIGTSSSSSPTTICDPNDMSFQLAASNQTQNSPPMLNMDPATQETQELLFLEPANNDVSIDVDVDGQVGGKRTLPSDKNEATPRQRMFVQGDAPQRRAYAPDLKFLPPSIKKLYRTICTKYSDYAFVYSLSAQLCQDHVPMDSYVYLKMALLISLASIELDEMRAPISLCIISNDSYSAHLLLHNIGQLAPRFIGPHEGGQQPIHTGLSSRFKWAVASPLLLAQQGVYYVGDWNRLTRDQTQELEKCIENGSVPVPQLQKEQSLEAAIWTYWQPENAANQKDAFAKLCPIFGLPVLMENQASESLWNFVLRRHTTDHPEITEDLFNIPNEDIRTLLGFLHQRQVTFTEEAEQLLQKYYVVSRIEQPTAFSSKTFIVLKQFAESIAKVALRLDVLTADVAVAIFHCEHFVRSIFGAGTNPPPSVTNVNVISRVDPYMNTFARWLYQYLDRYDDNVCEESRQSKRQRVDSF